MLTHNILAVLNCSLHEQLVPLAFPPSPMDWSHGLRAAGGLHQIDPRGSRGRTPGGAFTVGCASADHAAP